MAAAGLAGSITLRGVHAGSEELKQGSGSVILLRLNDDILQDMKKASKTQDGLRFSTGSTPVRFSPRKYNTK